jgi:Rne/Rng family ribonuclease
VRAGALEIAPDILVAEAISLKQDWLAAMACPATGLLREGPDAAARLLADYAGQDIRRASATFEQRGLEGEWAALQAPRIMLGPHGASLMIEKTAALTAIDVNTGTASSTEANAAAAREIARQIRLRNLSGLIVIDFASPGPRHQGDGLYQALQKALGTDPAGCRIAGITPSGLVELTRPRRDPPLAEILETAPRMIT